MMYTEHSNSFLIAFICALTQMQSSLLQLPHAPYMFHPMGWDRASTLGYILGWLSQLSSSALDPISAPSLWKNPLWNRSSPLCGQKARWRGERRFRAGLRGMSNLWCRLGHCPLAELEGNQVFLAASFSSIWARHSSGCCSIVSAGPTLGTKCNRFTITLWFAQVQTPDSLGLAKPWPQVDLWNLPFLTSATA